MLAVVAIQTLLLLLGIPQKNAPAPPMTNADVVHLVTAGLSDGLVVQAIQRATAVAFTTSPDALIKLKAAGVSETVIAAMLAPPSPPSAAALAPAGRESGTPHEAGIFVDVDGDAGHAVPIEPAVFTQAKMGGGWATAMTYGAYKAKMKAVVSGERAKVRTTSKRPTFYFYFDEQGSRFGTQRAFAGWLAAATSPNEFVLAQMIRQKHTRELVIGEFNAFGSTTGARSADVVPVEVTKLGPRVYRVVPTEDLGPGEFCFFYAGGAGTLGSGAGTLFDFGTDR